MELTFKAWNSPPPKVKRRSKPEVIPNFTEENSAVLEKGFIIADTNISVLIPLDGDPSDGKILKLIYNSFNSAQYVGLNHP